MMIWLNYLHKRFVLSGKLKRLIEESALKGLTYNPGALEKMIRTTPEYDKIIMGMVRSGKSIENIIMSLCLGDVRRAANQFIFVCRKSKGSEGLISMGVSSALYGSTENILEEARFLWKELNHKNVLIDVPAAKNCLPAIEQLWTEGISVKVSSPFSFQRYRELAESYLTALEKRAEKREPLDKFISFVSFNIRAIDQQANLFLDELIGKESHLSDVARQMYGKTGYTMAWMFYHIQQEIFSGPRFQALTKKGARIQQLIWDYGGPEMQYPQELEMIRSLGAAGAGAILSGELFNEYHLMPETGKQEPESLSVVKWRMYQLEQILGLDIQELEKTLEKENHHPFNLYNPSMMRTLDLKIRSLLEGNLEKKGVLDIKPPLINIPVLS
jgi:transaldolase